MHDHDYERLLQLCSNGDREAASQLFAEASRRNDQQAIAIACQSLGIPVPGKRYTLRKPTAPSPTNDGLNPQQRAVVTAPPGPMLVIAGAGSGKTLTLTHRVAHLIQQGIPAERILLLTFTRRAAREMLRRVANLSANASQVWGGTFHHIAWRLVRPFASELGYPQNIDILAPSDAKTLLSRLVHQRKLQKDKRFPGPDLLAVFSFATNTQQGLDEVLEQRFRQWRQLAAPIHELFHAYTERKREMGLLDYDDLLLGWRRLLRERGAAAEAIQQRFEYILVDEYQDTNSLQAELVDLTAMRHRNLMVVGDDSQAIYSFRGADPENILGFPDRYPDAKRYLLETNYRSTPQILALANASIAHNPRRFEKTLRPHRHDGPLPALVPLRDLQQQADFVVSRVLELNESGIPLKTMAVLYRAHYQSMELQSALSRAQIPYEIRSGERFFEQAHIKDVLAQLRFARNPLDELSFFRMARLYPDISAARSQHLWDHIRNAPNPIDELLSCPTLPRFSNTAKASTQRMASLLDRLRSPECRAPDAITMVLDSEYGDYVRASFANANNRIQDLEQLALFAQQFEDIESFLAELALITEVTGEDANADRPADDALVLSTIHQAKGLEWRVVFITSLWDGGFPTAMGQSDADAMQEERRLFYVAVTRAEQELSLSYPLSRDDGRGWMKVLRPSPLLSELRQPATSDEARHQPSQALVELWDVSEL
ncbi:MAG: ATP-dependent helicase [Myxococcota bacterium]|jgi:DNA helicase-2/ATP-dependent DNA helicase PcrA|nr:ATP-dependent helicase [Myxococcota bacterium]